MQEKKQIISPLKQRFLQFIKEERISQREFYLKTGVSRGTLTNDSGISEETMAKIFATYPNLNKEWIMSGDGEMHTKNAHLSAHQNSENAHLSMSNVAPQLNPDENLGFDIDSKCKNCQILTKKYFEAVDLIKARDLTIEAKNEDISRLIRLNAHLQDEIEECKGNGLKTGTNN